MSFKSDVLSDVAQVIDSLHKTPKYAETGYPMVRVTDIKYGKMNLENTLRVNKEVFEEFSKKYNPDVNDIIVSRVGSYGNFSQVKDTVFCLGQNTATIKPQAIDSNYLYACLNSKIIKEQIESSVVGSTQKTLSLKAIKELKIPRFEISIEEGIGDFLKVIDDRITLLRETNATLEAMAQALFKSWFVDFAPVHAKQQGRAPEGVDAATAALFPDSFEESESESELGMVPKGWKLLPFGECLSHTIGGDWGSDVPDETNDTRVAIIRGTDIPDLQACSESRVPIRFTTQKKLKSRELKAGDIVIEVSGGSKEQPTGRSILITEEILERFYCPLEPASFCRLFRPSQISLSYLLAQHLSFIYKQGKTWEYQNQSTGIANFQTTHFLGAELVAVPTDDVLEKFCEIVVPMVKKMNSPKIDQLAKLRDTLLPRLISGQLRLPEAQALAQTAVAE